MQLKKRRKKISGIHLICGLIHKGSWWHQHSTSPSQGGAELVKKEKNIDVKHDVHWSSICLRWGRIHVGCWLRQHSTSLITRRRRQGPRDATHIDQTQRTRPTSSTTYIGQSVRCWRGSLGNRKPPRVAIAATLDIPGIHLRCGPIQSQMLTTSAQPPFNKETLTWWLVEKMGRNQLVCLIDWFLIDCLFVCLSQGTNN